MYRTQDNITIDVNKFQKWVEATKYENGIKTDKDFSERVGFSARFIPNVRKRGFLTKPNACVLTACYGLNVDEIRPDKPKEEPKHEEPKEPETAAVDGAALAEIMKAVLSMQDFADVVKRGFRVQTLPALDTEAIAEGVRAGMEAFWRNKKDEIARQLRGIVFAATFEAEKKMDEIRTPQKPTTQIWRDPK